MPVRSKIFVVHGRDEAALDELLHWLEEFRPEIEVLRLEKLGELGQPIATEFERLAAFSDLAIVLVTPDDMGRLKKDTTDRTRARQNVWLEVGWFWGRLGRTRTLLLLKGKVDERPSDIGGLLYLPYENICQISGKLKSTLDSLIPEDTELASRVSEESSGLISTTEVVHMSTSTGTRNLEYDEIVKNAKSSLVVTGIGMANFRQQLDPRIREMDDRKELNLDFIILNKETVGRNRDLLDCAYRPELYKDLEHFERDLWQHFQASSSGVQERISLYRYDGLMSFVATISDPGHWGSMMLVETVLPSEGFGSVERPRLLLRRRVSNGLYDRYWKAVDAMKQHSEEVRISDIAPRTAGGGA